MCVCVCVRVCSQVCVCFWCSYIHCTDPSTPPPPLMKYLFCSWPVPYHRWALPRKPLWVSLTICRMKKAGFVQSFLVLKSPWVLKALALIWLLVDGIKSLWPFLWKSPFKALEVLVNHLRLGTVFESPGKIELVVCCSSAQVSEQWRCFSPFRLFLIHKSLTKKYAFFFCHIQWFMLSLCPSSWSYLSPVINTERERVLFL